MRPPYTNSMDKATEIPLPILKECRNEAIGLIKKEIKIANIKGEKKRNAIFVVAIIIIKNIIYFNIYRFI